MDILVKIVITIVSVLAALGLLFWIGLQIQPRPFDPYPHKTAATIRTVPLPAGLPAPVERFYRKLYGDQVPVIETAVITGRAVMRPAGPFYLPARFRFTHIAGQDYRHYIEATIFGISVFKVNERYVDGKTLFELPWATAPDDEKMRQGANLGLWSETIWMPSVFITDPRVRWEPVNDQTALLIVPFEDSEETYVIRFDPETDLIAYFESMRYHGSESPGKTLWLNESREWDTFNGQLMLKTGAAIWMDDGKPWAIFNVEDVAFNVEIGDYIYAKGQ